MDTGATSNFSIQDVLAQHELWVMSGGTEGSRARISGQSIKDRDLTFRNLDRVEFDNCDLTNVRFDDARLREASFASCLLAGSSFRDATLSGARFVDCRGMTAKQFAGANLEAATLPQPAADFPNLKRLSEISKSSNTLLLSVLGACVTSIVALANVSDVSLIANSGSLPVLGTSLTVPTAVFVVAMPSLVVALWLYFLLTLQHVWEEFADLPKIFPDGEARHRKAELWLIGSYVQHGSSASKMNSVEGFRLAIFYFLIWALVPTLTLAAWATYLRRHEWTGTYMLTFMTTIAVSGAMYFLISGRATLNPLNRGRRRSIRLARLAVLVALPSVLLVASDAAVNASRPVASDSYGEFDNWTRRAGLAVLGKVHIRTNLQTREVSLSDEQKRLSGVDIRRIDAYRLMAPKVDLRDARITEAFLREANLNEARLEQSNLQFSYLADAQLQGANLNWAKMELSTATGANFTGAQMSNTQLIEASLKDADFSGARLTFSDFRGADLRRAIFRGADLEYANLFMADLRGADFTGAKNVGKIDCISQANVAGVIGLQYDSIKGASEIAIAEEDDDYRRALAANRQRPTCGMEFAFSPFIWSIEGPPAIGKRFSPRSLRRSEVDILRELPPYLQRDVAGFLRTLEKTNARELAALFKELKENLGYGDAETLFKDELILTAERKGDPLQNIYLSGIPIDCGGEGAGFQLRLWPYAGFRSRLDLDEFVISILRNPGVELGTERQWSVNGGLISESAEGNAGPQMISYRRCSVALAK
ncbi:pentapeptide repeat-containing protein [Bradyrhizobium ivorense]|uniref:pentapeptide repeat-containing protein n=1 Tax=Bradyrhizobium ivorense TaxID=2511166 RepID=UPI0010BBF748|nr:pentapeptide repeat-containing protein [Bradyrhizobium ivorense]VIO71255.1 Secreted effector protein PipB2 [Bradyrhizobium ivorense]